MRHSEWWRDTPVKSDPKGRFSNRKDMNMNAKQILKQWWTAWPGDDFDPDDHFKPNLGIAARNALVNWATYHRCTDIYFSQDEIKALAIAWQAQPQGLETIADLANAMIERGLLIAKPDHLYAATKQSVCEMWGKSQSCLLRGANGVGKSTMVRHLARDRDNVLEFNLQALGGTYTADADIYQWMIEELREKFQKDDNLRQKLLSLLKIHVEGLVFIFDEFEVIPSLVNSGHLPRDRAIKLMQTLYDYQTQCSGKLSFTFIGSHLLTEWSDIFAPFLDIPVIEFQRCGLLNEGE